jgi:superfamily I DNA/RNA helicase
MLEMELDINQKQLLNYDFNGKNNDAICLVAGAGSGKTTTIVHTIVKLISNNYLPQHFLITTFTRSAAKDLKVKLKKYLSSDTVDKMIIGTFHEIAGLFLEKYKKTQNMIITSYDDCLYNYAELLISDDYIECHKYIFIDEYQDINDIQELIIQRLYENNKMNLSTDELCNKKILVVIGDDQQNIYTFRGSNISYMLNFVNKYNGKYIYLLNNYRCPDPIVEMSNNVLIENKNKIDKTFVSSHFNDNKIILLPIKANQHDIDKYNYLISSMILKKIYYLFQNKIIGKNTKTTLTIISRFNYTLKFLETILTKNNIKSTYLDNLNESINNRIILSTIHGTKGLEFDHVIYIDYIPNRCTNMIELEEERRLFYVAISRVKCELTILYNLKNPSCFLRECWDKNPDIFINLPEDYSTYKIDYNFFKKSNYVQYNIETICKNLSYENILKLNDIIPFRSFLIKDSKKCKILKIHDNIEIDEILKNLKNDQTISCYEHLYETIANIMIVRYLCNKYHFNVNLDIIQSIIFKNYGLIKNMNNINFFIEYINKTYGINLFNCNLDLDYIKKYAFYSYKVCPKYLNWDHIIEPKFKEKFTDSVNNYFNSDIPICKNKHLLDTAIVLDMTINNRLSIQYLDIKDKILNKICKNFNKIYNLTDEIDLIDGDVKHNEVYVYNSDYVIKSDFIIVKENKSMVLGISSGNNPDINNLLYQLSIALAHNLNCENKFMINKVNLYVPLSGQIYQIDIEDIDKITGDNFLRTLTNIN